MIGRLCLLEAYSPMSYQELEKLSEQQRTSVDEMNRHPFDSYSPPSGMSVSWYWNIPQKYIDKYSAEIISSSKLVIGLFQARELQLSNSDNVFVDGDILREVINNRCFAYLETIPFAEYPEDLSHVELKHATAILNPFVTEEMTTNPNNRKWFDLVAEETYLNYSNMRLGEGLSALPDRKQLQPPDIRLKLIDGGSEYLYNLEFIEISDPMHEETVSDSAI